LREKNYFFKFKKYEETLLKYLQKPDTIVPEWRRQEAINFVKGGLEDFSISREKKRLSWGIPVPGDESQVMYVWFDALTSYISTLGWPSSAKATEGKPDLFEKFWINGTTLQVAGKDQVRFQSLMWQAMLMSAGIKNTDQIFYHGFITSGGQKMSKSLGNVINPYDLVKKYGTDATRYFLLRHVHPFEDTGVTWEKLDEWYTANLTNGLGNFVSRVMKMSEDNLDIREIKNFRGDTLEADAKDKQAKIHTLLEQFRFNDALDEIWKFIAFGDELIQKKKPFQLIKENPEKGKEEILNFVWRAFRIANFLEPFMPDTSRKIRTAFQANQKPDNLFPRLL
jgi:methionyl-tRNA synthetase